MSSKKGFSLLSQIQTNIFKNILIPVKDNIIQAKTLYSELLEVLSPLSELTLEHKKELLAKLEDIEVFCKEQISYLLTIESNKLQSDALNDLASRYEGFDRLREIFNNPKEAKRFLTLNEPNVELREIKLDFVYMINSFGFYTHQAKNTANSFLPIMLTKQLRNLFSSDKKRDRTKSLEEYIEYCDSAIDNLNRVYKETESIISAIEKGYYLKEHYDFENVSISILYKIIEDFTGTLSSYEYQGITYDINFLTVTEDNIMNLIANTDINKLSEIFEVVLVNGVQELCNKDIELGNKGIKKKIKINFYTEDNYIVIRIEDNGRGIKDTTKIFQQNFSTKKDRGGTGVGLGLAKKIANGLDIKFLVSSIIGEGSSFFIKIPFEASSLYSKDSLNNDIGTIIYSINKVRASIIRQDIADEGFDSKIVSNRKSLEKEFSSADVVIIDSSSVEEDSDALEYIRNNKSSQVVIGVIDKNSNLLLEQLNLSRTDSIVFRPTDNFPIRKRISKIYNKNILKSKIAKIHALDTKPLEKEFEAYFQNIFHPLIKEETFAKKYSNNLEAICSLVETNTQKYKILLKENFTRCNNQNNDKEFPQSIVNFLLFTMTSSDDKNIINQIIYFSKTLVHAIPYCKAEDKIFKPLAYKLIEDMKSSNIFKYDLIDNVELYFVFIKTMIANNSKLYVQNNFSTKREEIQSATLHFLMTSITHLENNFYSPFFNISRNIAKYQEAKTIKEKEKFSKRVLSVDIDLKETTSFANNISELFSNYSCEKNTQKISQLIFLIQTMFSHALSIKKEYSNITLDIDVAFNVDTSLEINTNSNTLSFIIYTLIENAKEANATNIGIYFRYDVDELIILVSNNGEVIDKDICNLIFNSHLSTKQGHSGLGLTLAKQNVEYFEGSLKLLNSEDSNTVFELTIPYSNNNTPKVAKKYILVCDDESSIRDILKETILDLDIDVVEVSSYSDFKRKVLQTDIFNCIGITMDYNFEEAFVKDKINGIDMFEEFLKTKESDFNRIQKYICSGSLNAFNEKQNDFLDTHGIKKYGKPMLDILEDLEDTFKEH